MRASLLKISGEGLLESAVLPDNAIMLIRILSDNPGA